MYEERDMVTTAISTVDSRAYNYFGLYLVIRGEEHQSLLHNPLQIQLIETSARVPSCLHRGCIND